jgi:hypothetical protein
VIRGPEVIERASEEELQARLAVTEVTGIAGRRQRGLEPWGIRTCLDFARADRRLIRGQLTAAGEALWWKLLVEPVLPLHPERPRHKFLSRGGSFGESTDRPAVNWAWAVRNVEGLVEELEFNEIRAGRVQAWLAYREAGPGRGTLA